MPTEYCYHYITCHRISIKKVPLVQKHQMRKHPVLKMLHSFRHPNRKTVASNVKIKYPLKMTCLYFIVNKIYSIF